MAQEVTATKEEQKAFALAQVAPYYKNPLTCGYVDSAEGEGYCKYKTEDGRMCIAGKNMIFPEEFSAGTTISSILAHQTQAEVFKPELVGKLSNQQWESLQRVHDVIASGKTSLLDAIKSLKLFTLQELKEYAAKL